MGIADLVETITTAARPHLRGVKVAISEDTVSDLPALVVGWPSNQVLNVTVRPGGRDLTLSVDVYVAMGADGSKAWKAVQGVVDGPLIAALNEALQPAGLVQSIGQVLPVTVGAGISALRIPLNIATTL